VLLVVIFFPIVCCVKLRVECVEIYSKFDRWIIWVSCVSRRLLLKIYLWTINIFIYRMKEDLMQIYFALKEEKKSIFSVISFQIYELYFSINTDWISIDSPCRNTIRIESLGHGKRFGTLDRIRFETDSCNPLESFVKLLIIIIIIVERRAALSPRLDQYCTELGKQIFVCSLSFSRCFLLLLVFTPHYFGCLINLLYTSSILLVWFLTNSH